MTYCEEVGLKVGDKIRYLGDGPTIGEHSQLEIGDEAIIILDDGDSVVDCVSANESTFGFDLESRIWEKVVEEENSTEANTPTPITKDTIVNVKFTMEELFFIYTIMGSIDPSGCREYIPTSNGIINKVEQKIPLVDEYDHYSHSEVKVFGIVGGSYQRWVDSHFMSPAKAKALELRKQAEELINQAEELEGK